MIRREHRRRYAGVADLLTWGAVVADGVVVNKDGSLLAGFEYRGPDLGSATPEELAGLAEHVNRALSLGDNWMIHADALRLPSEGYPLMGAFPDPVTRLIEEERREQYTIERRNFDTRYLLVLTYLPPTDREEGLARFILGAGGRSNWIEILGGFEQRLEELQDTLSAVFSLHRLDSSSLLTHLHTCLTGHTHPVALPPTPCYLDSLLASEDLIGGLEPRIGEQHLAVVALMGLPASTAPAMLEALQNLPFAYRWSNRFIPLDPPTAAKHILRYRRNWYQKRRSPWDVLRSVLAPTPANGEEPKDAFSNRDALEMAEDADAALQQARSGRVQFGYYTSALVLMHPDRTTLDEYARQILRVIRNSGVPAQLDSFNALEAFRGSLPGHGYPNVRRPLIHTQNLAHLIPTTSVWSGLPTNPNPLYPPGSPALLWAATAGSTPFRLNLHAGSDVGHTLVVGPTGSGKSVLVTLLQAQFFRYPNAQVFTFDKGYSSFALVAAAGGVHYDIAADSPDSLGFYPLQRITSDSELAFAAEWVEGLVALQGIATTPAHRQTLQRALELLAAAPSRTLTALWSKLQDPDLRSALRPYTLAGLFGRLFDSDEDPLHLSDFSVFEMSNLLEFQEKAVGPLLLYLFHRIEERLDGRPTLIVLEEAWRFLANTVFADRIQAWLRELRKRNAVVVFVTQSLADLHSSQIRDVLYSSCPTRIFLANPGAATESSAPLYRDLGLNRRKIELIAGAVPKRQYFVESPLGSRLIELNLGPATLSFVGASSRDDLRTVRELLKAHGPAWPGIWLRQHGLDRWADRIPTTL